MITKEKTNVRNGVNVDQLFDTVKLVQEQPEIGKFEFRAKSKWINGGHCVTSAKNYYGAGQEFTDREEAFTMEADHPPVLLGEDKAPTPAEIVLHGLGTCLIGAMMYHAAANGIDIQSAEASLEGDVDLQGFLGIDQDVRKGFEGITVNMKVKSDASAEQLEELARFSPVFDVVTNPTPVNLKIEKQ